jgi:hypothetical protein
MINTKIEYLKKEILRLTGVKLERLSKITHENDHGYIYDFQILASLEIILAFVKSKIDPINNSRSILLFAQTQSGKTGVCGNYKFLIEYYDDLRNFLGLTLGNSFFITAMSDVANKQQIEKDLIAASCTRKDKQSLLKGVFHNPDLLQLIRNSDGSVLINSTVIDDESHLAPNIDSVNNKFKYTNGLSNNGLVDMVSNNCYSISISATPYDELSGNIEYGTKKIIKLEVGENYRGIQYFKDNNLLKQTFVLNDSTKDKFKKEMCSYGHKLGYYLVRIGNIKNYLDFVPNGFNSLKYFQEDKIDINNILSKLPDNPTIIFVKNKMKQSYQLEKKHIVVLFDRGVKNKSNNRGEFNIQSFSGRGNGYHKYDFMIYTDIADIENHIKLLNDDSDIPTTKNTIKTEIKNDSVRLSKFKIDDIILKNESSDSLLNRLSEFKIDIIERYLRGDQSCKLNSKYFYKKDGVVTDGELIKGNITYDDYITRAYDEISNKAGLSNHKYIDSRNKEEYKNGDTVFALYVDMDNNTIIIATKYITDDSKLEKYVYEINKKCSYSDNGRPTCGVDPALNIKSDDNIAILSGTEIKIYLNREGYIVLPKGTKGLIEIDKKYLDFDILNQDIKINFRNKENRRHILKSLSSIISNTKTEEDFIMKDGRKYVDFLAV